MLNFYGPIEKQGFDFKKYIQTQVILFFTCISVNINPFIQGPVYSWISFNSFRPSDAHVSLT